MPLSPGYLAPSLFRVGGTGGALSLRRTGTITTMFYASHALENSDTEPLDAPREAEKRDLDVLAWVHTTGDPRVSQRTIAHALGMSLGLTNAILKRLTDKGFLMVRRINQHNAHYLVTGAGIDQISRRSYRYLRRTIGHVVRYKERLRAFCRHHAHQGIREIRLLGESDLTFILEWCAQKEGLAFRHITGAGSGPGPGPQGPATEQSAPPQVLTVLAETIATAEDPEAVLLHQVLLGDTAPPADTAPPGGPARPPAKEITHE